MEHLLLDREVGMGKNTLKYNIFIGFRGREIRFEHHFFIPFSEKGYRSGHLKKEK